MQVLLGWAHSAVSMQLSGLCIHVVLCVVPLVTLSTCDRAMARTYSPIYSSALENTRMLLAQSSLVQHLPYALEFLYPQCSTAHLF